MQLSTRGRYAVMALIDLAQLQGEGADGPVTLADIAERQELSLSYLEQLFAKLRRQGLVKSVRGPGGGYILAKSPAQTWLFDIVSAVEEKTDFTRCDGLSKPGNKPEKGKGCVHGEQCNAHNLWLALGVHLQNFLQHVSLEMVLNNDVDKDFSVNFMSCRPAKISIQAA